MFKLITDVLVGDTIMDGSNRTKVTNIETCASSRGTKIHINEKDCYESFSEVRVQD